MSVVRRILRRFDNQISYQAWLIYVYEPYDMSSRGEIECEWIREQTAAVTELAGIPSENLDLARSDFVTHVVEPRLAGIHVVSRERYRGGLKKRPFTVDEK